MADEEDGSTSATGDAATPDPADEPGAEQAEEKKEIDVIYVADIDVMSPAFLRNRAQPDQTGEFNWQFENVTFMLNITVRYKFHVRVSFSSQPKVRC